MVCHRFDGAGGYSGPDLGSVAQCSEQSNMHFGMGSVDRATEEIAAADHPAVRFFQVKQRLGQQPLADVSGALKQTSPATTGPCSPVAYRGAMGRRATLDPAFNPHLPPLAGRKMAWPTSTGGQTSVLGMTPTTPARKPLRNSADPTRGSFLHSRFEVEWLSHRRQTAASPCE